MTSNPYKVLDVSTEATKEQIKRSFRRLALQFHPDKNRGDERMSEERFVQLRSAYEILIAASEPPQSEVDVRADRSSPTHTNCADAEAMQEQTAKKERPVVSVKLREQYFGMQPGSRRRRGSKRY